MRWIIPVIPLLPLIVCSGCGTCEDRVQSEVVSPDKTLEATSFVRNCGATTDYSVIVSIHRTDNSYKDDNDFVFVAKGSGGMQLKWTGPKALDIHCEGCERKDVFRRLTVLGDIDISYP
jgi:hypothetical protein